VTVTTTIARPQARRIATYIAEMFPPQTMVAFAAFHFLAVWLALHALAGIAPVRPTWAMARGIATVALFLFLMRLYDELRTWTPTSGSVAPAIRCIAIARWSPALSASRT
jgi:hypothetical protein